MEMGKETSFFDRLCEIYPEANGNKTRLGKLIGVGSSAMTFIVNGRLPELSRLIKISQDKNVSLDWLVFDRGEKETSLKTTPGADRLQVNLAPEIKAILNSLAKKSNIAVEVKAYELILLSLATGSFLSSEISTEDRNFLLSQLALLSRGRQQKSHKKPIKKLERSKVA